MTHRSLWESITIILLICAAAWILAGAIADSVDMQEATPIAGMSIATATLALVRKP